jgi:hypothetical protein
MKSKKISKKLIREKQQVTDKNFRKNMLVWFSVIMLTVVMINILYFYWCEIQYQYRLRMLYNKEVPVKLVCMHGDKLERHESTEFVFKESTFYACSTRCVNKIKNHFQGYAFTADAFSGDTISKPSSLIGLKEKGSPEVVYFQNRKNFNKYYEQKNNNK